MAPKPRMSSREDKSLLSIPILRIDIDGCSHFVFSLLEPFPWQLAPSLSLLLTFTRCRSIGFIMLPWKNSTVVKCRLNSPSNSKSGGFLCGSEVNKNVTKRWRHRRTDRRRVRRYGRTQRRKQAGRQGETYRGKSQRQGQGIPLQLTASSAPVTRLSVSESAPFTLIPVPCTSGQLLKTSCSNGHRWRIVWKCGCRSTHFAVVHPQKLMKHPWRTSDTGLVVRHGCSIHFCGCMTAKWVLRHPHFTILHLCKWFSGSEILWLLFLFIACVKRRRKMMEIDAGIS